MSWKDDVVQPGKSRQGTTTGGASGLCATGMIPCGEPPFFQLRGADQERPVYERFELSIEDMVGLTFSAVKRGPYMEGESLIFTDEQNRQWKFYHCQSCCESVWIEDICGDLEDLVGSPMVLAEETTNEDAPPKGEDDESYTWTFYRFATAKGTVTVRWYGVSNGYYSESVDLEVTRRLR